MRPAFSLSRHHTFRWNNGSEVDTYSAVEVRDHDLVWYTWSHLPGPSGGRQNEFTQTRDDFVLRGPPIRDDIQGVPPTIIAAVRAWIEMHP
jgi:hypothetical protein